MDLLAQNESGGVVAWLYGMTGLVTAITALITVLFRQLNQTKRALADLRKKVADDTSFLTMGFLSCNNEGMITLIDPILCSLSGWKREELLGKHIEILIPPEARSMHRERFAAAVRSPWEVRRDIRGQKLLRKDGRMVPIHIQLAAWEMDHNATFVAMIQYQIND